MHTNFIGFALNPACMCSRGLVTSFFALPEPKGVQCSVHHTGKNPASEAHFCIIIFYDLDNDVWTKN